MASCSRSSLTITADAGIVDRIYSLPPVAPRDARLLILGSMPGRASLAARQYYAHPRNAFWTVLGALFGFTTDLPYRDRLRVLRVNGVALWDVLASCTRSSSLDADIDAGSVTANDFSYFFRTHPNIMHVFFNGTTAERMFFRHVRPGLPAACGRLAYRRLPSTSPAHAAQDLAAKIDAWKCITR